MRCTGFERPQRLLQGMGCDSCAKQTALLKKNRAGMFFPTMLAVAERVCVNPAAVRLPRVAQRATADRSSCDTASQFL